MLFELGRSGAAAEAVATLALAGLCASLVALARRRADDDAQRWLRASAYFCGCLLASWATGVLDRLLTGPVVGDGSWSDPAFVSAFAGCILLEVVAYGVVWPLGTYTLQRPRDLRASLPFGVAWGLTEAQLLLAGWALVERAGWSTGWTIAGAFVLLSAFQGTWHALYWDVAVAPEHNVPAWNLRKVLLCHVPNLVATLTFLAAYDAPLLFVALQTLSLSLSSVAMRFPRPAAVRA